MSGSVQFPPAAAGRGSWGALLAILLSACALAYADVAGTAAANVAAIGLIVTVLAVGHRQLLQWHVLATGIVVTILLIPIGRYVLPGSLPFELEPYRLLIAIIATMWVAALLFDRRVSLRRTPLDPPIVALFFVMTLSLVVNASEIVTLGVETEVVKTLTFWGSFAFIYVFCTSVLRRQERVDFVIRALVITGAIVAALGIFEYWTGENYFLRLSNIVPGLHFRSDYGITPTERSGRLRVVGSSQHPIEFAALSVMLIPLSFYLWKKTLNAVWFVLCGVIFFGGLAAISRTGIVMLIVVASVFLVFRPAETRRMIPLIVPILAVIWVLLPNALGSFYSAFFPQGGILSGEQNVVARNDVNASGRVADLRPWWLEFEHQPVVGHGLGARVYGRGEVSDERARGRILDDQWLGLALELGALGVAVVLWLFGRSSRRLARLARSDPSPQGWLPVALIASLLSYAVGMATFDAFSFRQVTIVLFLLLGLSGATLMNTRETSPAVPTRVAR